MAVAGNYAYVADEDDGLRVISVSDPAHPVEVGYYGTPGWALGVAVAGNYAYVADENSGLRVVSVSDPAYPSEVGYCIAPDVASGVAVVGNYAYVADGHAGLQIYQFYGAGIQEGDKSQALSLEPEATIVRGVLELPPAANRPPPAALLDVSGRKVLDLHPGANDVSRIAPGVYFVRLADGERRSPVYKVVIQH